MIEESVLAISGNTDNQFNAGKKNRRIGLSTGISGLAEVEQIAGAILQCGNQAKDTLMKKVVPQLKELEFHNDAAVRAAAKGLRTKIEAAPLKSSRMLPTTDKFVSERPELLGYRARIGLKDGTMNAHLARRIAGEDSL